MSVQHCRMLRVPCIIGKVCRARSLVELSDMPGRFWLGTEDLYTDD
jgi:hypothetical protein